MRAGFVVIALVAAGATAACGPGSKSQDQATPAASPIATERPAATPTIEPAATKASCPVPAEVCDFARRAERQLAERDVAGVVDDAPGRRVTCTTGVDPGLGADFPLCDGASPGEVRMGYGFARFQSEGSTVDRAGLGQKLSDWLSAVAPSLSDSLGAGATRAFTIGCADSPTGIDCSSGFSLVFSAILRGNLREILMLVFTPFDGGRWGIVSVGTGIARINMDYLAGGTVAGWDFVPIGG